MSGLGDHFLFFSSFKKLDRCKIRHTLQCSVAERTAFPPMEKSHANFLFSFMFQNNVSVIAGKKNLQHLGSA